MVRTQQILPFPARCTDIVSRPEASLDTVDLSLRELEDSTQVSCKITNEQLEAGERASEGRMYIIST